MDKVQGSGLRFQNLLLEKYSQIALLIELLHLPQEGGEGLWAAVTALPLGL